MLAGSMQRTKTASLIGLPIGGVGYSMMKAANETGDSSLVAVVLLFVATTLFVLAGMWFARGRGHSGWFGALGVFGLFGLLPLYLLSDRFECCEKAGPGCKHIVGGRPQDWSSRAA